MLIKNMKISAYQGEEKSGYDRMGQKYRTRYAQVWWQDEDGKRSCVQTARLDTQSLEEIDLRGIQEEVTLFDADVSFSTSRSNSGYLFNNMYINKIV